MRQECDAHIRHYLQGGHFCSSSYFAGSCDGRPLSVARHDIENQQRPIG
ncbi:hypothetical protein WDA79_15830 [Streptomyces sp. A475]